MLGSFGHASVDPRSSTSRRKPRATIRDQRRRGADDALCRFGRQRHDGPVLSCGARRRGPVDAWRHDDGRRYVQPRVEVTVDSLCNELSTLLATQNVFVLPQPAPSGTSVGYSAGPWWPPSLGGPSASGGQ